MGVRSFHSPNPCVNLSNFESAKDYALLTNYINSFKSSVFSSLEHSHYYTFYPLALALLIVMVLCCSRLITIVLVFLALLVFFLIVMLLCSNCHGLIYGKSTIRLHKLLSITTNINTTNFTQITI
jgi:hypothetical protein